MPDVLPPAAGTWWDESATTTAVFNTLRLSASDVDADAVEEAVNAAAAMIDNHLDSTVGVLVAAAPLNQALRQLAVELYKRKDDPPGNVDVGAILIEGSDALEPVRSLIDPYRERWGVA